MKGFSLIEILIAFSLAIIAAGIGITSFSSYNKSQLFGQSVSNVVHVLGTSRSKAISQVKPSSCGSAPLQGYEVRVTVSGADYVQYVKCGGSFIEIARKKLSGDLTFASGSMASTLFNVSDGTVSAPGAIVVTGSGKTSTVIVDKSGKITVTNGAITYASTQPTPTPTTGPASASCTPSTAQYRFYPPSYCIDTGYPGYGTYCESTCGGQVVVTAPAAPTATSAPAVPTPTSTTATTLPTPTPTQAACSKDYYYSAPYCVFVGANRGTHCDAACGGGAAAPTATSAPAVPTPTPTTATTLPTPTPTQAACSKDYYYSAPYCVFVGANRGTHCDAACTR